MLNPSLSDHPVYMKAQDICLISKCISSNICEDLNHIDPYGLESDLIYCSGDIVQQSLSLGPEILKAEALKHSEAKYKHLEHLNKLTSRLIRTCRRLERSRSKSKDFLPILKREVKTFKHLQKHWMLTL